MSLSDKRRRIEQLLNKRDPADAQASYYAFYHPDDKTQLFTLPDTGEMAEGYLCLSRTGIDLFRPLMTLRLPRAASGNDIDFESARSLVYSAMTAGSGVILSTPEAYYPFLSALFEVQTQQRLQIMILDPAQYEPVINVLVVQAETYNGLPRFLIRSQSNTESMGAREVAASAGLNWRSPHFAEIYVHTKPAFRRRGFGRSVVAAVVGNTLDSGRTPLYAVAESNRASIQLAESVGFEDTGSTTLVLEATLKPQTI